MAGVLQTQLGRSASEIDFLGVIPYKGGAQGDTSATRSFSTISLGTSLARIDPSADLLTHTAVMVPVPMIVSPRTIV
jgi:hypothetical protein